MKNILTNLMTSAVLLFTIGSGLEAQSIRMQAAVPFAWQVNGQKMNAGEYAISGEAGSHVVAVRSRSTGKGTYLLVAPGPRASAPCRLVFHRYGDRYFLAQIVGAGLNVARLPISAAEKQAMQAELPREAAMVFVDVRPVVN